MSPESPQPGCEFRQLRRRGARHKPAMPRTREPLLTEGTVQTPRFRLSIMRRWPCWEPGLLETQPCVQRGHCSATPPRDCWAASGPSHKSQSQGLGLGTTSGLFRDLANAHQIPKSRRPQTTHPDDTVAAQDLRPRCLVQVVGISGNRG